MKMNSEAIGFTVSSIEDIKGKLPKEFHEMAEMFFKSNGNITMQYVVDGKPIKPVSHGTVYIESRGKVYFIPGNGKVDPYYMGGCV